MESAKIMVSCEDHSSTYLCTFGHFSGIARTESCNYKCS